MKDFIFLFRSPQEVMACFSPAQIQEYMEKWGTWLKKFVEDGIYEDGDRLDTNTIKVISGKERVITDGPFAESKEIIGGYIRIKADSFESACALAKDCPVLSLNGSVEIRATYEN